MCPAVKLSLLRLAVGPYSRRLLAGSRRRSHHFREESWHAVVYVADHGSDLGGSPARGRIVWSSWAATAIFAAGAVQPVATQIARHGYRPAFVRAHRTGVRWHDT